jgi:hypothetical protein
MKPNAILSKPLSPEEIAAYLAHATSRSEKERMDDHLRTCDPCLLEAVEARRIATVLEPGRLGPVPEAVKLQAEALWRPALSRVVLRLVQRGLQQVTHSLTAPILNFELEPTGAMTRSSPAALEHPPLTFRLDAENASVQATTVAARDGLALTLTFYRSQQEILPGSRVRVQQEGMTVFSAKTDAQGQLHVPYLSPGVYDVTCPELQVVFQLELRSDPDDA